MCNGHACALTPAITPSTPPMLLGSPAVHGGTYCPYSAEPSMYEKLYSPPAAPLAPAVRRAPIQTENTASVTPLPYAHSCSMEATASRCGCEWCGANIGTDHE